MRLTCTYGCAIKRHLYPSWSRETPIASPGSLIRAKEQFPALSVYPWSQVLVSDSLVLVGTSWSDSCPLALVWVPSPRKCLEPEEAVGTTHSLPRWCTPRPLLAAGTTRPQAYAHTDDPVGTPERTPGHRSRVSALLYLGRL